MAVYIFRRQLKRMLVVAAVVGALWCLLWSSRRVNDKKSHPEAVDNTYHEIEQALFQPPERWKLLKTAFRSRDKHPKRRNEHAPRSTGVGESRRQAPKAVKPREAIDFSLDEFDLADQQQQTDDQVSSNQDDRRLDQQLVLDPFSEAPAEANAAEYIADEAAPQPKTAAVSLGAPTVQSNPGVNPGWFFDLDPDFDFLMEKSNIPVTRYDTDGKNRIKNDWTGSDVPYKINIDRSRERPVNDLNVRFANHFYRDIDRPMMPHEFN